MNVFSPLDVQKILAFLPHRYPFLLLDKILSIETESSFKDKAPPYAPVGTKVQALKNITMNEWYFRGHFPQSPLVPGVLLLETMAQAASFSVYPSVMQMEESFQTLSCLLIGIDRSRFRYPVIPGDTLLVKTELKKAGKQLWFFSAVLEVQNRVVAEAELVANLKMKSKNA